MEGYTVQRLMKSIGVPPGSFGDIRETVVSGITTDSRNVKPGEVFFALKGERYDGADYVDDAARAGAILSVINAKRADTGPYASPVAVVENTIEALGKAAADYRSTFAGKVVAITGTSGKTTVKEMLIAILARKYRVHGTAGNFNNRIGLPLTMFGLRQSHDCAVFELGMSAAGEIAELAAMCKPDIGVILNVGPGHAEFFESIEAIADAKMELLGALADTGLAIINGDDELLRNAGERTGAKIIRFGLGGNSEYRAEDVMLNDKGCPEFRIQGNAITLKVPGRHTVYNALAAYAVGREMGVDSTAAGEALMAFEPPKLRMQLIECDGIMYINDSYNANPVSMKAAANVLRYTTARRKIAVLGDMLELGAMSERAHSETGELFAQNGIDLLCLIGDFAESYRNGALRGGMKLRQVKTFPSAGEAATFLNTVKRQGDLILVKGSRGMRMERIIEWVCGGGE